MHEVASELLRLNLEQSQPDVPSVLQHGNRKLPLGRYLRGRLRTLVGRDAKAPEATIEEIKETLRPLFEDAFENSKSKKEVLVKHFEQARLNQAARAKIRKKRGTL